MPYKDPGPLHGGFAPNAGNFVSKLIFHECSVPFQLYVETFIPCFLNMLVFILWPYADDIIREAGEAIAHNPGTRGSRRGRHSALSLLPEPEAHATSRTQRGLQTVLRLSQPLETIGYAFLLYAGTERFFYQWHSALYGFEFCGRAPSTGPFQRHAVPGGFPIDPGGLPLFLNILDQDRAGWGGSNQICALPRGHYQVTFEATFNPLAFNVSHIGLYLQLSFGIAFDIIDTGAQEVQPGGTISLIISAHCYFPALTGGSVQWLYYGDAVPIGVDIPSASISIYNFEPGLE